MQKFNLSEDEFVNLAVEISVPAGFGAAGVAQTGPLIRALHNAFAEAPFDDYVEVELFRGRLRISTPAWLLHETAGVVETVLKEGEGNEEAS